MAERLGQQLGNYRLVRLLGIGGFAEVYLGEHVHLESQAAIKVLRTILSDEHQAAFLTEARRLVRLRHPHIVRLLDFGIEGETPFLVMDYAPNGSLRTQHPKGSKVDLETVVVYVKQVAAALQYIHDQKLLHRDVKPENLLLGEHSEVLLSDLGLAAVAYTTGSIIPQRQAGTPPYMAPEQIQHVPRRQSDQYALGIVVYEWLCGVYPFQGLALSIMMQHLTTSPPALRTQLPTIPADVEQVVLTALAKDPKQRFARVQDFAVALEQAYQTTKRGQVETSSSLPSPAPSSSSSSDSSTQPKADDLPSDSESDGHPAKPEEEPLASSQGAGGSTKPLVLASAASSAQPPLAGSADPQRTFSISPGRAEGNKLVKKQQPDVKSTSPVRTSQEYLSRQAVHPLLYRLPRPHVKQPLSPLRSRFITSVVLASLGLFALIGLSVYAVLFPPKSPAGNGSTTQTIAATVQVTPSSTQISTPTPNFTATAQAVATATQGAANATATAIAGATVTARAIWTVTAGTPSYTDPLNDPTNAATVAAQWGQNSHCRFQQDGYHVTASTDVLGKGQLQGCLEEGHQYTNFALSVDLTILSGHTGGVFFRVGPKTLGAYSGYLFEIDNQGNYKISRSSNFATGSGLVTLIEATSSALKTGTNATNTLQIFAGTNSLSFYVNNIFLSTWNDTTLRTGYIAFLATTIDGGTNADMLYSNLKVYTLS